MVQIEHDRLMIAEPPSTQWYESAVRPIVAADNGMLVVGRTGSHWFVGQVTAAGTLIEPLPAANGAPVETESVIVYTLLDPPVRLR